MLNRALALACLLFALNATANAQTEWYVDDDSCPSPGTGTVNDPYCSIQVALEAAAPGDTIHVAEGLYVENIAIAKPVTLIGQGAATTLDGAGVGDVITVSADDVSIRAFTIQRSGPDCVVRCAGVRANAGCLRLTLDDNIISDNAIGVAFEAGADACVLRGNRIEQNQQGIVLTDSSHITVTSNDLYDNASAAVYMTGTVDSALTLNVIRGTGILAETGCDRNTFADNTVTQCSQGLAIHGSLNSVTGNTIDAASQGIVLLGSSAQNVIDANHVTGHLSWAIMLPAGSLQNTVSGNIVSHGSNGIFLAGTSNVAVANAIEQNSGDGILLGAQSVLCEIRDNSLTANGSGVHLASATSCTITGNQFLANGLWIEGDEVAQLSSHTVTNNMLGSRPITYHVGVDGLAIPADAAQVVLVECTNVTGDNLVLANAEIGLLIASCSDVTLRQSAVSGKRKGIRIQGSVQCQLIECTVANAEVTGIAVVDSSFVTLDRCVVRDGKQDGIRCERSDDATLTANTVTDNANFGIYLLDSCRRAIVTGNTITGNNLGVFTDVDISDLLVSDNILEYNNNGLHFTRLTDSLVIGNRVDESALYGMKLIDSSNNTVQNNEITGSHYYAIRAGDGNNTFTGNIVTGNNHGMLLGGDDNVVTGNVFSGQQSYGIDIRSHSSGGFVSENTITGNRIDGILLSGTGTTIRRNTIHGNGKAGIRVEGSGNEIEGNSFQRNYRFGVWLDRTAVRNRIFHNNFHQQTSGGLLYGRNARDDGANRWDAGALEGGNYWGNYTGLDDNGDGFGDTAHAISGRSGGGLHTNRDRFPLMVPYATP